jgi:hypothetical protein
MDITPVYPSPTQLQKNNSRRVPENAKDKRQNPSLAVSILGISGISMFSKQGWEGLIQ